MNRLSLYVHVPFCRKKCRYCDFVSFKAGEDEQKIYFDALKKEMEIRAEEIGSREISTVYFGGGTPSSVKSEFITETLDHIYSAYNIRSDAEITVEANPESLTPEKAEALKKAGFNRLSMGLQSANNSTLKRIGRIHSFETFLKAFNDARSAGFDNINVDLMFSLPKETMEDFRNSLSAVTTLSPEHISTYSLILEEDTDLFKDYENGLYTEDDLLDRDMYHECMSELKKKGYEHYEISNFAKKGYHSRHNTYCWDYEEYLGFGINASSFFGGVRMKNTSSLNEYLSCMACGEISLEENQKLFKKDMMGEYVMLALRKTEGLDIKAFSGRFQEDFEETFKEEIAESIEDGLAEIRDGRFRLTCRGLDFASTVMMKFI